MLAKTFSLLASSLALTLATALAAPGPADAQAGNDNAPEIRVTGDIQVDGRATVGSWDCQVTDFDGDVTLADDLEGLEGLTFENLEGAVEELSMSMSAAMACDDGGDMDEYSRDHLEVEDHPAVDFEMNGYEVVDVNGNEAEVELDGFLTISGDERSVTIPVVVSPADGLRVTGAFELDMTDYNVDPPRMMLGAIRVRDDVEISFDLVLEEA